MKEKIPAKAPPTWLLMFLSCLASVSAVTFTPALPEMSLAFSITKWEASASMSYYLLGYCLGFLIYPPFSNRFGRKIALLIGLGLGLIGSILCITSSYSLNYELFIGARFIQALGMTAGLQGALTFVADCYKVPKSTKVLSFLTLSFGIGPSIGVVIGGVLTQYFGWISSFYFLTIYSIAIFLLCLKWIQETLIEKDLKALNLRKVSLNYFKMIKKPKIFLAGIFIGLGSSFPFVFATLAPFIAIDRMSMSSSVYSYYYLITPAGIVLGSFIANVAAKHCRAFFIIFCGVTLITLASISMFVLFFLDLLNPITLFVPMLINFIGIALNVTNILSVAMHYAEDKPLGSSLINFMKLGTTTLVVYLFPRSFKTVLVMPSIFLVICFFLIVLYFVLKTIYKRLAMAPKIHQDSIER